MSNEAKRIETEKKAAARRRLRRLAMNLRLEDVAPLIGIDFSQLHRWERGKALPTKDKIAAWDKALDRLEKAS